MRSHSTDGLLTWSVRYLSSVGIGRSTTDPEGPYVMVKHNAALLPVFAHGASVRKLPPSAGGGFWLMHLGCGYEAGAGPPLVCATEPQRDGGSRDSAAAAPTVGTRRPVCNQFNVSLLTARTLHGPWMSQTGAPGGDQLYLGSGTAQQSW